MDRKDIQMPGMEAYNPKPLEIFLVNDFDILSR